MIDYVIPDQSIFHNNNLDEVYEQIRAYMSYFDNKEYVVKLKRKNDDMLSNDPVYARVSPWSGSSPTIQECMCSECRWGAYQFIIFIKK